MLLIHLIQKCIFKEMEVENLLNSIFETKWGCRDIFDELLCAKDKCLSFKVWCTFVVKNCQFNNSW